MTPLFLSPVRRLIAAAMATGIAAAMAGCSLSPASVTSTIVSSGSGNRLTLQFDNALNLSDGAHVVLNGVEVGTVESVSLTEGGNLASVVARVDPQVAIPVDARGAIKQSTVLGDPYVSITARPRVPSTKVFEREGTIPLSKTASPPPLEDTLAVLANFVNGNSIQNAQSVVQSLNAALPDSDQVSRVADISAVDLHDLARGTDRLDGLLDGVRDTAQAVIPRIGDLEGVLSTEGEHYWGKLAGLLEQVGVLVPSVGSIFEGGYWLVPLLTELSGSIHTVRDGLGAIRSNDALIRDFLSSKIFPFLQTPEVRIVAAHSSDGKEILDTSQQLLRMLGASR